MTLDSERRLKVRPGQKTQFFFSGWMTLKDQVSLCVTEMLDHVCCQDIGHALAYTIGIDWKGREVGQMQRDGVAARKLGTNIVCLSTSLSPSHLAHLLATLPTSLPPCPATTLIATSPCPPHWSGWASGYLCPSS